MFRSRPWIRSNQQPILVQLIFYDDGARASCAEAFLPFILTKRFPCRFVLCIVTVARNAGRATVTAEKYGAARVIVEVKVNGTL